MTLQPGLSSRSPGVPDGSWTRAPSNYVLGEPRRLGWLGRSAAAGLGAVAAAGLLVMARNIASGGKGSDSPPLPARRLYQGAALLSLSVLADSGLVHYRANFRNRAMLVAPAMGLLTFSAAVGGQSGKAIPGRKLIFGAALATGGAGLLFHFYNVGSRLGGFSWVNLFYGAPLGAPAAAGLAGIFGMAATGLEQGGEGRLIAGVPAAESVALVSSVALVGTSSEAALLHFRGAFQNPFMLAPVAIPPLAAALLAGTALKPAPAAILASRALLGATAAIGVAGVGFHSYGIARNMGGWKNWSQMLLQAPPLPAPPSFSGIALAGLGALRLLEDRRER